MSQDLSDEKKLENKLNPNSDGTNSSSSSGNLGGEGNTSLPPPKKKRQISPAKRWCFTFNNYTSTHISSIVPVFEHMCSLYGFSEEVGDSGTKHLQGYCEFNKKCRPMSLELPKEIHWEKCKGSRDDNIRYITKQGMCLHSKCLPVITRTLFPEDLRPFQKEIVNIIHGPVNEGKILWIYDEIGQLGKTELVRFCHVRYGVPFSYGGKCADIINLVFNNKDDIMCKDKPVLFYNFGRDTDPNKISYKSMEQISDGCICNTKFEAGCFVCNKPHVVVFANCLPVITSLSKGRFIIKTIDPDELCLMDFQFEF